MHNGPTVRPAHRLLAAIVLALAAAACGAENRLAVIVRAGSATSALEASTVANIFKRRLLVDEQGQPWAPVNLPANHPLRAAFSAAVLHRSPQALETYWNELYFQGLSPPYVLGSPAAVRRFVATTPGAIGYLPECELDDSVVAVLLLPLATPAVPDCKPR